MAERELSDGPRYTTELFYNGFRILLTLPYENAGAIVGTMNQLIASGFTPKSDVVYDSAKLPEKTQEATPEKKETKENGVPICPTHNKAMVQRQGQFGMFWACPYQRDWEMVQLPTSQEITA